jgi:hypothetical protein
VQHCYSSFSTHRRVFDASRLVHIGEDLEPGLGAHAMVLVGWRRPGEPAQALNDSDSEESEFTESTRKAQGGMRFLVQSWWREKQFFEVDLVYLVSRGAHLTWVMTKLKQLPSQYPLVDAVAAESWVAGVDTGMREVDRWT